MAASSVAAASVPDASIASAESVAAAPEDDFDGILLSSSECTRGLLRFLVPGLFCAAPFFARTVFIVEGNGRAFLPAPVATSILFPLGERAKGSRARSVEGEWREALEADSGRAGETGRRAFDGVVESRGLLMAPLPLPLPRLLLLLFKVPVPLPLLLLLALGRLFVGDFPPVGRLRGLEMDRSTSLTPTGSSSLLARSRAAC